MSVIPSLRPQQGTIWGKRYCATGPEPLSAATVEINPERGFHRNRRSPRRLSDRLKSDVFVLPRPPSIVRGSFRPSYFPQATLHFPGTHTVHQDHTITLQLNHQRLHGTMQVSRTQNRQECSTRHRQLHSRQVHRIPSHSLHGPACRNQPLFQFTTAPLGGSELSAIHRNHTIHVPLSLSHNACHIRSMLSRLQPYMYTDPLRHVNEPQPQPIANLVHHLVQEVGMLAFPHPGTSLSRQRVQRTDATLVVGYKLAGEI